MLLYCAEYTRLQNSFRIFLNNFLELHLCMCWLAMNFNVCYFLKIIFSNKQYNSPAFGVPGVAVVFWSHIYSVIFLSPFAVENVTAQVYLPGSDTLWTVVVNWYVPLLFLILDVFCDFLLAFCHSSVTPCGGYMLHTSHVSSVGKFTDLLQ